MLFTHLKLKRATFNNNSDILSIYNFLEKSPEKYYCRNSFKLYFSFLQECQLNHESDFIKILKDIEFQLDISIRNLIETNNKNFHLNEFPSNDLKLLTFIEHNIHYNYLKIIESAFSTFLYIPAKISRISRNKRTDDLAIYNVVEELKNGDFSFITEVYNNTIRNGIAHGKVKYTDWDIIYEDNKGNKEQIQAKEIIIIFDKLLNIVNGFLLAYSIFCFTNQQFFMKNMLRVPNSLLINELQEKVNTPGWQILDCLDSVVMKVKEQLIVYVKNDYWNYQKVLYSSIQTAYWIERLTKSYDRIVLNIDSKHSINGWAGFDALELRRLREADSDKIEDYSEVLENKFVFFNPKLKFPKLVYRLGFMLAYLKVNIPYQIEEVRNNILPKRFIIRDTQIHSQQGYLVINDPCIVIKKGYVDNAVEVIREEYDIIVRDTIKFSKRKIKGIKKLQKVKFIRICIFDKDERVRNLRNSGLHENLIGTISYNISPTIKTIDINGGIVEEYNKYRIVWNKNWRNISLITSQNQ